jgi:hypothetical protein
MASIAVTCILLPLATASSSSGAPANRTLIVTFSGSGSQKIVNAVVAGEPKTLDKYTKTVTWDISWRLTIYGSSGTASSKVVNEDVGGLAKADVAAPGLKDCSNGMLKGFSPLTLQGARKGKNALQLRVDGNPNGNPVDWATSKCYAAGFAPFYAGTNKAAFRWLETFAYPTTTLNLANNFQPTPATLGQTWTFPPLAPQVSTSLKWKGTFSVRGG